MSNMSYCRFENTLSDLRDCYEEMANNQVEENLSRRESRSFAEIVDLCREIAEMYEDYDCHELIEFSTER